MANFRVATSWKSSEFFFAVLEVLEFCLSPEKSLKISGRFPVLHWDGIVKLLSLIISTKIGT